MEDYTRLWVRLVWFVKTFPMRMFNWDPDFTPTKESPMMLVKEVDQKDIGTERDGLQETRETTKLVNVDPKEKSISAMPTQLKKLEEPLRELLEINKN
ncbi:hypothetical protein LIER_34931 [Lithospermum erythrorhizon]|uniref:Uncharacterized protein n=1 Tax=Lithospermum erythrorhizon TaxID=34254 RepID=A0AAV3NIW9_LITER